MYDVLNGLDMSVSQLPVARPEATGNFVRFYKKALKNNFKTEQMGSPQFDAFDYIEITSPGGLAVNARKVTEQDKINYPDKWRQYKENQEQIGDGFPVEQWPLLTVVEVELLKHFKIHTVEQLAAIPDGRGLDALGMGARALRQRAIDFLSLAKGSAPIVKLRAENERLSLEVEILKKQFKEKFGEDAPSLPVPEAVATPKRKRGRPHGSTKVKPQTETENT